MTDILAWNTAEAFLSLAPRRFVFSIAAIPVRNTMSSRLTARCLHLAAATTGAVVPASHGPQGPFRPFALVERHARTGVVLLAGLATSAL